MTRVKGVDKGKETERFQSQWALLLPSKVYGHFVFSLCVITFIFQVCTWTLPPFYYFCYNYVVFCCHGAQKPQKTWGLPVLEPCKPGARDISVARRRKKHRKGKIVWLSSHTEASDRAKNGLYPELIAQFLSACSLLAVPVLRETCLCHLFLWCFLCASWTWDFLPETASPAYIFLSTACLQQCTDHFFIRSVIRITAFLPPTLLKQSTASAKSGVKEPSFPLHSVCQTLTCLSKPPVVLQREVLPVNLFFLGSSWSNCSSS